MSKFESHQGKRQARRPTGQAHGVLLLDKPPEMTSFDVVSQARRIFRTRKIGHAGTLDPMATGVLVLLLGEATKLSNYLTLASKSYRAEIVFGSSTDSLDRTGKVLRRKDLEPGWLLSAQQSGALEQAFQTERARSLQIPPLVSAIKVDGERAYKKARRGEEHQMAPRPVQLKELRLIEVGDNRLTVEIDVSKGYYVRSFARDLGDSLGVPAHLAELRRLSSGAFSLQECIQWPKEDAELMDLSQAARRCLPSLDLTESGSRKAEMGQLIETEDLLSVPEAPLPAAHSDEPLFAGFFQSTLVALLTSAEGGYRVKRGIRLNPSPE